MPDNELLHAVDDAEEALVGAILIEATRGTRSAIDEVSGIVSPTDFRKPQLGRIFNAMLSCSLPPHQINVALELQMSGKLEKFDCAFLSLCVSNVPCSLDYRDYARAVKSYSLERSGNKPVHYRGAINADI